MVGWITADLSLLPDLTSSAELSKLTTMLTLEGATKKTQKSSRLIRSRTAIFDRKFWVLDIFPTLEFRQLQISG